MLDSQDQVRFEQLVLPHLDAAFNLARWLLRSPADAEDAAQEAMLRSYKFFPSFRGGDGRFPALSAGGRQERRRNCSASRTTRNSPLSRAGDR